MTVRISEIIRITVTVTDASGNSITKTVTVTVVDDLSPQLTVQDATLSLDASGNASLQESDLVVSKSDNCMIASTTLSKTSFDCSNTGNNTVSITVTDGEGNSTTKTVTVTVVDNISPNLTVQNATLSLDASGNASLQESDIVVSKGDNCSLASTTLSQTNLLTVRISEIIQ